MNILSRVRTKANDRRYLVELAVIAIAYMIAAKAGLLLAGSTHQVTPVWPAAGIAMAILLVRGRRYAPGILIGAFIANLLTRETVLVAAGIAIGDTLEVIGGGYLLQRFFNFKNAMESVKDILSLVFVAGLFAPVAAATIGTATLAAGGLTTWSHYGSVWALWWAGDALGIMLFAPLVLAYFSPDLRKGLRKSPFYAMFLMAVIFASTMLVYTSPPDALVVRRLASFVVFPLMVFIAFRFNQIGIVTATVVITATALWATAAHLGPYATGNVQQNLLILQIYIVTVSLTTMLIAIVVDQRNRASLELRRRTEELHKANDRITGIVTGMLDKDASDRSYANAGIEN